MDNQAVELLMRVETRTRQLLIEYRQLLADLDAAHLQIAQKQQEIDILKQEREEALQRYERLKMAKYIDMADDDIKDIHGRIRKMVRNVDKCIALLKTE